ncbi:hypothetical protein EV122DRAFT_256607 [Schizophyllum commune]
MANLKKLKVEVEDEEEDPGYDSSGFISACQTVNLNDVHSGPGLCIPKFHASLERNDVRDDPKYTTYFHVLADERYGGGVYIDKDDLGWSLQGVNPKPKVLTRTSWWACVDSWQNMCRLALHAHAPPKDFEGWLARIISPSSPSTPRSPLHTTPSSSSQGTLKPRPVTTSLGRPRSTVPALVAPVSDDTRRGRVSASFTYHAPPVNIPKLRAASPLRKLPQNMMSIAPIPMRARQGADAGSSSPVLATQSHSPAKVRGLATPQKLIFASRGTTPEGGVVTRNSARAEQLLEEHGEVFISRRQSGLTEAVNYLFEVKRGATSTVEDTNLSIQKQPAPAISPARLVAATACIMPGKRKKAVDDPTAHIRGRTPWALGTKRTFMQRFFPQWSCLSRRKRGPFYDHVVCAFIAKYGMYFDVSTDLEEDIDDPDPTGDEIDHTTYSPEECLLRTVYTDSLRTKISQWFRDEEQRITKAEADDVDITRIWDTHVATMAPQKAPANLRITHYYSSHHYTSRVKATFEPVWAAAQEEWATKCRAWKEAGVPIPTDEEPAEVAIRTRITNECWEREPESFRALVTLAHDQEKEARRAAREAAAQAPSGPVVLRTPQDYQRAIDNAAIYIQPAADAFAAKLGMICTVLLVGPLPEEGGAIGMVSVHSGELPGGVQWFDFDRSGYGLTERSYIGFGEQVFSTEPIFPRDVTRTRAKAICPSRTIADDIHSLISVFAHIAALPTVGFPRPNTLFSLARTITRMHSNTCSCTISSPTNPCSHPVAASHGFASSRIINRVLPSHVASPRTVALSRVVALSRAIASSRITIEVRPSHVASTWVIAVSPHIARPRAVTFSRAVASSGVTTKVHPLHVASTIRYNAIATAPAPSEKARSAWPDGADLPLPDNLTEGDAHVVWSTTSSDNWPLHIRDTFAALMQGRQWGTSFAVAVQAFLQFEGHFGFPLTSDGRRLIAGSLRPAVYLRWERLGRPYEQLMSIEDVEQYSRQYWLWWEAAQPAQRLPEDKLLSIEKFEDIVGGMEDWGGLDACCGKDGVIQALMMLFWWGGVVNATNACRMNPERWMEWDMAVQDFGDVLILMMNTPGFEKRSRKASVTGEGHTEKTTSKRKASSQRGSQAKRRRTPLSTDELAPIADAPPAAFATRAVDLAPAVDVAAPRELRDRTKLIKTFKARLQR